MDHIRVSKKSIPFSFFLLSAIVFNAPLGISYVVPMAMTLIKACELLLCAFSFLLIVKYFHGLNRTTVLILIYVVTTVSISFLVNGVSSDLFTYISIFSLTVISNYGIRYHRKTFLKAFTFYFFALAVVQILCQILFPGGFFVADGYTQNWIMGHKNVAIYFLVEGLAFCGLLSNEYGGKKGKLVWLFFAASVLVVYASKSATAYVGLFVFAALYFVFHKKGFPKIITLWFVVLCSMAAFVLIYFFNFQYNFEYIIVNLLGKSMDFSNRTLVWQLVLDHWKQHFVFGIGQYSSLTDYWSYIFNHAHQYWLQIGLTNGIVGLLLIFLAFFSASRSLRKADRKTQAVILAFFASMMVMGIDEILVGANMVIPFLAIADEYGRECGASNYPVQKKFRFNKRFKRIRKRVHR